MASKVKHINLWKCNIDIFFTYDVSALSSTQIDVPHNVKVTYIT